MEQNSFDVIQMAGAVLLFVFALSYAMFSYSNINHTVDQYIDLTTANRRGNATTIMNNEDEIYRETDRAEIIMSVAALSRTVQTRGNEDYSIIVRDGTNEYKFQTINRNGSLELMYSLNGNALGDGYYNMETGLRWY